MVVVFTTVNSSGIPYGTGVPGECREGQKIQKIFLKKNEEKKNYKNVLSACRVWFLYLPRCPAVSVY